MPNDWGYWSSTSSTYSYSTNVWTINIVNLPEEMAEALKKEQHLGFDKYLDLKK